MSIEKQVWDYFINKNFTPQAVAGLMGNFYIESQFRPNNLQDDYNRILGMSDEDYTRKVNLGIYTNFVNDGAGYGLAQWTYAPFKKDLLQYCQSHNKPISDLNCQLEQLYLHLQSENLLNKIKNSNSIAEATEIFMKKFEKPKIQTDAALNQRIQYAEQYYQQFYKGGGEKSKMKYSRNNPPLVCMQTQSTCYQQTSKMAVKGILIHSTGANNPYLKRYVQPSDNDPNRQELLAKLGKNTGGNDWNHIQMSAGLNAWIGKLADGTVTSVQTMPWDYKPWGCGSGSRGSCNNGWIQFEICEDLLIDGTYFTQIYKETCELVAYLCYLYDIGPFGKVDYNGISVPKLLCHADSAQLGLGSNHADIYHWFNKYGVTMDNIRYDVAALLSNKPQDNPISPFPIPSIPDNSDEDDDLLGLGDIGENVLSLQKILKQLGYNVPLNSKFDTATYQAVIQFQKLNKLDMDGIVGPNTLNKLKQALNNIVPEDEIYRVRRSWDDPKSQIGAYKSLNNAKSVVDKLGHSYRVYNSKGQEVYPDTTTVAENVSQKTTPIYAKTLSPSKHYDNVMLASAAKDEKGRYTGGVKGDQTGQEVLILPWYNQHWDYILRPTNQVLAENIARQAEAGCANDNIGYNQSARNTIYIEAKKVGLDLSKISTPCDCDCSSFVSTCCICAGLPASIFYPNGNMLITSTFRQACEKTKEFIILSGSYYTNSKDYLKRGDIILNTSSHVAIVLQDGDKADENKEFRVLITVDTLNIREQPNSKAAIKGQVKQGQAFTIIQQEGGYGKLKSGVGWIELQYTKKL